MLLKAYLHVSVTTGGNEQSGEKLGANKTSLLLTCLYFKLNTLYC